MPQGTVEVQHPEGLHARPAAEFVKLANRFKSTITLRLNGRAANGKSIMAVMGLGANMGAHVDIEVQGEDADQAYQALTSYLTERTA
jgi:phosphotransferase system enzyme I (PtsI)